MACTLPNISPPHLHPCSPLPAQLASLPALSSLKSLKLLDVSLNQLASLPDMGNLANLETINLSLNKVGCTASWERIVMHLLFPSLKENWILDPT